MSVLGIILYLTPKVGPLPAINCTFYACDQRIHATKAGSQKFSYFFRGPMFVRYKMARSWLVIVCLFTFIIPKTEKALNIKCFLF